MTPFERKTSLETVGRDLSEKKRGNGEGTPFGISEKDTKRGAGN